MKTRMCSPDLVTLAASAGWDCIGQELVRSLASSAIPHYLRIATLLRNNENYGEVEDY
jgi:hypothetical protein